MENLLTAAACPGCGGRKSKRAVLCRACRKKANAVGATVVTQIHEAAAAPPAAPSRPRTPQQNTVYHGKLADLARFTERPLADVKRQALVDASRLLGRPIGSSTEITEIEMERFLEYLDTVLRPHELAASAAGATA